MSRPIKKFICSALALSATGLVAWWIGIRVLSPDRKESAKEILEVDGKTDDQGPPNQHIPSPTKRPELIQFEKDFALVGGMSGDSKTLHHVKEIMQTAGIRYTHEGSVAHDIYVDRKKVEQVVEMLRTEISKGWGIRVSWPD